MVTKKSIHAVMITLLLKNFLCLLRFLFNYIPCSFSFATFNICGTPNDIALFTLFIVAGSFVTTGITISRILLRGSSISSSNF